MHVLTALGFFLFCLFQHLSASAGGILRLTLRLRLHFDRVAGVRLPNEAAARAQVPDDHVTRGYVQRAPTKTNPLPRRGLPGDRDMWLAYFDPTALPRLTLFHPREINDT